MNKYEKNIPVQRSGFYSELLEQHKQTDELRRNSIFIFLAYLFIQLCVFSKLTNAYGVCIKLFVRLEKNYKKILFDSSGENFQDFLILNIARVRHFVMIHDSGYIVEIALLLLFY